MTVCNMSIEAGAPGRHGGAGRHDLSSICTAGPIAPKGADWDKAIGHLARVADG